MPDYPISYIVTFAVNGVMVLVVLICLVKPRIAPHAIKINLSLFISGLVTLMLPWTINVIEDQKTKFSIAIFFMVIIGITMGLALA